MIAELVFTETESPRRTCLTQFLKSYALLQLLQKCFVRFQTYRITTCCFQKNRSTVRLSLDFRELVGRKSQVSIMTERSTTLAVLPDGSRLLLLTTVAFHRGSFQVKSALCLVTLSTSPIAALQGAAAAAVLQSSRRTPRSFSLSPHLSSLSLSLF